MAVLLKKTGNLSSRTFFFVFLFIKFVGFILLLNQVLMRKIWTTRKFDVKADRSVHKANSKRFLFNFATKAATRGVAKKMF